MGLATRGSIRPFAATWQLRKGSYGSISGDHCSGRRPHQPRDITFEAVEFGKTRIPHKERLGNRPFL